jgi:hypothetical protein
MVINQTDSNKESTRSLNPFSGDSQIDFSLIVSILAVSFFIFDPNKKPESFLIRVFVFLSPHLKTYTL